MRGRGCVLEMVRALLFLFAFAGLGVSLFGGGCALVLNSSGPWLPTVLLIGIMMLAVIGNIVLLVFVGTGEPPGPVPKAVMTAIAVLDIALAVAALGQASAQHPEALVFAAIPAVKAVLTLLFAWLDREEE